MLSPHARFASFVVGSANRLAATASRTVADSPGAAYNPLFIYARPGLGKTHLLMAIGHGAKLVDAARTVEYVTVDDLVEAWHAALAAGEAETYRRRFSEADLVLIDDAQLLTDRRELQAELIRLIDVMMAADKQIVLASDRPPEEIQALDERLIRRFAGGLVVDIGMPDYETRLAILSRRADERQVVFESAVLAAVAERPIGTVRELLGALNRLIAHQAVQIAPLNVADARVLLASLGHANTGEAAAPATALAPSDGSVPPPSPESFIAADEFNDFLSDLSATMAQQIDHRRQRLTEAMLRFAAAGVRTTRLENMLSEETLVDPTEPLALFTADVETLATIREAMTPLAPELLNDAVFYDPDRVADAEALLTDVREAGAPLPGPSPRYGLDGFAEGPSTRPVIEAVRAAARAPGQRYNPLVIVGAAGTGKTHLLHAFGHALRESGLSRVAVFDARQFVDDLVTALGEGSITRWRQRLRRVDALLLDDVGGLAGKERSQEELYLLYNVLLESGRQMAFTTSVTPSRLVDIEPRLATRLSGGLVVELGAPDPEARHSEAERLLGGMGEPELVDFIASRPVATLRELQLLVHRLQAAADERGTQLTLEAARLMLDGSLETPPRPPRRGSGLLAPGAGAIRSREKMVDTWPEITERLIEEWELMAIKGSLKEASLPDVVQLLYLGRRTGCMSVANDRHFASIWFDEGWITFAGLLARSDRLGDRLIAAGKLTTAQLDLAITTQQAMPGRRLGTVLLQLGMTSQEVLERELRVQVEETIFTLFSWDAGTFSFEAGVKPEPGEVMLRLNPEGLLLEGARRVDEWSVISRKVPSPDVVFALEPAAQGAGEDASQFEATEQQVLELIDGLRTVREIADTAGLTEFDVSRVLYALVSAGRLRRVATSAAPVTRGSESRVEEHRNLGLAFYRTGMLSEAEREYRRVAELRPLEGEGPFHLGLVALRQGRWADAVERLRRAAELAGPRPAILHNLALALEGLGKLDEADAAQAEAVKGEPERVALWIGWGLIALRRQEIAAALERFDRARTLLKDISPPARWFWGRGWAHALSGEWTEAVSTLREGVAEYPSHPVLRTALGVLLESAGEVGDAETHLRHALAEDPTIPQISKNLGDLLYRSGRWDEAEEAYRRASTLAPTLGDDVFFKLGNLACRRGDLTEARRQWEAALTINPNHALVRANLAGSRIE